jgi:hypothetical protein
VFDSCSEASFSGLFGVFTEGARKRDRGRVKAESSSKKRRREYVVRTDDAHGNEVFSGRALCFFEEANKLARFVPAVVGAHLAVVFEPKFSLFVAHQRTNGARDV